MSNTHFVTNFVLHMFLIIDNKFKLVIEKIYNKNYWYRSYKFLVSCSLIMFISFL